MKNEVKIVGLLTVIILGGLLLSINVLSNEDIEDGPVDFEGKGGPPGIDDLVPKSSFEDVITVYQDKAVELRLPSYLPGNLKPTVAYTRITETGPIGVSLFLYSDEGIEEVATAELVIEVRQMTKLPFDPEISPGKFININGYDAYYNDKASVGHEEYCEKYGETARLLSIQIGNMNYLIRAEPSINMDELMQLAISITEQ